MLRLFRSRSIFTPAYTTNDSGFHAFSPSEHWSDMNSLAQPLDIRDLAHDTWASSLHFRLEMEPRVQPSARLCRFSWGFWQHKAEGNGLRTVLPLG
jgi:hypothetical protein